MSRASSPKRRRHVSAAVPDECVGYCTGSQRKRQFASKAAAKRQLKRTNTALAQRSGGAVREGGVYECSICGFWHTTKRRGGGARRWCLPSALTTRVAAATIPRVLSPAVRRDVLADWLLRCRGPQSLAVVAGCGLYNGSCRNTALTDLLCLMGEGRARMVREPAGLGWERTADGRGR